jgi:hypothetical protein
MELFKRAIEIRRIEMKENTLSVIGLFLTLFGILGSLFAIHIANWYREMLSLEQKFEQNKAKDTAEEKTALRECRYKLRELYNSVTWFVSLVLTAFLLFVFYHGCYLVMPYVSTDSAAAAVARVAMIFLIVYLLLIILFLFKGYSIGGKLNKALNPAAPK